MTDTARGSLDLLDRAFMHHARVGAELKTDSKGIEVEVQPGRSGVASRTAVDDDSGSPDVTWDRLADAIEESASQGRSVVAVVAASCGEGCSTIAAGAAEILRRRGQRVAELAVTAGACGLHLEEIFELEAGSDIVIVDVGRIIGNGRLRRERLAHAIGGCRAVVVVRRESRSPIPRLESMLTSLGVSCLGEVITFCGSSTEGEQCLGRSHEA